MLYPLGLVWSIGTPQEAQGAQGAEGWDHHLEIKQYGSDFALPNKKKNKTVWGLKIISSKTNM